MLFVDLFGGKPRVLHVLLFCLHVLVCFCCLDNWSFPCFFVLLFEGLTSYPTTSGHLE